MAQINRTRESSPCKNGPWKTHPDEQMVKTGIRHIAKYVPKSNRTSDRLDQAIHILNEYDGEGKIINEDEPVLLINESQHSELHAILTNLSISNPDRQLNNLARSFRVQNIKQLPNDKFREAKDNQKELFKKGRIPSSAVPQIHGCIWCCDAEWWDFASYCPYVEEEYRLYIQRVPRDEGYIKRLEKACKEMNDLIDTEVNFIKSQLE